MNEKAEFAVNILKKYASEHQTTVRSTSDLSPLEEWLILRLFVTTKLLPILEEGMILEYKDLTGRWYEYTKDLQVNIHFEPLGIRVRNIYFKKD
jgi:hypothetical protein